jgi:long-chain acyl-CoA synthetase
MYDCFRAHSTDAAVSAHDFLGERERMPDGTLGPYRFASYADVAREVDAVGAALGAVLQRGDFVGLFVPNSTAWIVAQYACYRQGLVPVPLYATLGDDAVRFIAGQTEMKLIFCSPKSVDALLAMGLSLHTVVVTATTATTATAEPAPNSSVQVVSWDEFCARGKQRPVPPDPAKPDELAFIVYTSGSTGTPKGAMITHRTVCHAIDIMYCAPQFVRPCGHWRYISYLPLSHVMELELVGIMIKAGAAIGFFSGNIANLFDDIAALNPNLFATVPRVWKRLHDKVEETVAQSSLRSLAYNWAL